MKTQLPQLAGKPPPMDIEYVYLENKELAQECLAKIIKCVTENKRQMKENLLLRIMWRENTREVNFIL
jgi:hypothetical protein